MLFSHAVASGGPRLPRRAGRDVVDWVVVTTDAVVGETDGTAVVCVIVLVVGAPLATDIACCNLATRTDFRPVDWRPSLVQ